MCPKERTNCSLMHVLKSLGHKNLQLLLGMRSPNKHLKNAKMGHFQCRGARQ